MAYEISLIVNSTGANITTSGVSARVAIPFTSDGATLPRFVRVAATVAASVRMGSGSVVAVAGDFQVQPGDSAVLTVPKGATSIAALQVSAAGLVNVVALEN